MTSNIDIYNQQNYYVVKSNEIIQKSRFSMALQQYKLLLYIISKIKPNDEPGKKYTFTIGDYCRVCNIDDDSGKNYADLKAALKDLADKSMWMESPDGNQEILLRWLNRIVINKYSGTVEVEFHPDMFPYLLDLQERYTQYKLECVLAMRSKYSVRLYELLKSYEHMETIINFSIVDLKKRIDCDKYPRFPDFRRYALDKAIEDINRYSDIQVKYRLTKEGSRAYTKISFFIVGSSGIDAHIQHFNRRHSLEVSSKKGGRG